MLMVVPVPMSMVVTRDVSIAIVVVALFSVCMPVTVIVSMLVCDGFEWHATAGAFARFSVGFVAFTKHRTGIFSSMIVAVLAGFNFIRISAGSGLFSAAGQACGQHYGCSKNHQKVTHCVVF